MQDIHISYLLNECRSLAIIRYTSPLLSVQEHG